MPLALIHPTRGIQFQQRHRMGCCQSLPWPKPGPRAVAASNGDRLDHARKAPDAASHTLEDCVFCQIACGLREQQKVVFQVRSGDRAADWRSHGPRKPAWTPPVLPHPPLPLLQQVLRSPIPRNSESLLTSAASQYCTAPYECLSSRCRAIGWWCSTTAARQRPPTCKWCLGSTSTTWIRCGLARRTMSLVSEVSNRGNQQYVTIHEQTLLCAHMLAPAKHGQPKRCRLPRVKRPCCTSAASSIFIPTLNLYETLSPPCWCSGGDD